MFSSHHPQSMYTVNMLHHGWCWPQSSGWGRVRFLHCEVTLFPLPFPCYALWKEVCTCSPHLKNGELCSLSFSTEYLHKLLGLVRGRFTPSLIIIYSIIYHVDIMSVWTHAYLFYTLGYDAVLFYFIAYIFPIVVIESSSIGSCFPLKHSHQYGFVYLWAFLIFWR